jgi:hypothetical protein
MHGSGPMSPELYQRFINYTAAAGAAAVPAIRAAEASDSIQGGVPARAQRTVEALTKLRMRQVSNDAVITY